MGIPTYWIELHTTLPTHHKTIRLATELKIPRTQAVGMVSCLWLWAANNAPDGDLTAMTNDIIAFVCDWTDEAALLIAALIKCQWLDQDEGSLVIHDWMEYGGKNITQKEKFNAKRREKRSLGLYGGNKQAKLEQPLLLEEEEIERFSKAQITEIYQAYPKPMERAKAEVAIRGALLRIASGKDRPLWLPRTEPWPPPSTFDWLLARVRLYAQRSAGLDPRFIVATQRWFQNLRYADHERVWAQADAPGPARNGYRNGRGVAPPDEFGEAVEFSSAPATAHRQQHLERNP